MSSASNVFDLRSLKDALPDINLESKLLKNLLSDTPLPPKEMKITNTGASDVVEGSQDTDNDEEEEWGLFLFK